jgi:flavorubredoxin
MQNIDLFENGVHRFVLLNESEPGEEDGIRSNQYLIQHGEDGVLLDPGGFGVMPRVLTEMLRYLPPNQIKAIILSHQDPDIVGGISAWLELTHAPVYISSIWLRFIPHYGIDEMARFTGVPDAGQGLNIAPDFDLQLIPAHFLHSEGQINVYDPQSKILFSGDIGAAMLPNHIDEPFVDDFSSHIPYIEDFHRRYMCSNKAARHWVRRVSKLDIEMIAPQHGPIYRGKAVKQFLEWFNRLECGVDLLEELLGEEQA